MGHEDQMIAALRAAANGTPAKARVYDHLRKDARRAAWMGPEVYWPSYAGSWNIGRGNRVASYVAGVEVDQDRETLVHLLEAELGIVRPHLGLMGRELGSRLYAPFVVTQTTVLFAGAVVRKDWALADLAGKWLRSFWCLAALASSGLQNGRVQGWYRGPTCALTGQRTPVSFQDDTSLDVLLSQALSGSQMVHGVRGRLRRAVRSWMWPARLLQGRSLGIDDHARVLVRLNRGANDIDLLAAVKGMWNGCVAVRTTVFRGANGTVACWQSHGINGNTMPTLGAVFSLGSEGPIWLHPHREKRRALVGEGMGECRLERDGDGWRVVAQTGLETCTAELPWRVGGGMAVVFEGTDVRFFSHPDDLLEDQETRRD